MGLKEEAVALISKIGLHREPTLNEVRDDSGAKIYVFCGYDGRILMSRPLRMPWHGLVVSEGDIQALPSLLRRFPAEYNFLQRIGYCLVRLIRQPRDLIDRIKTRFCR